MKSILALAATLAIAACAAAPAQPDEGAAIPAPLRLTLGSSGKAGPVTVAPMVIVEDSRCPSNVQCIQAGTVRVDTRVLIGGDDWRPVLKLNETLALGGYSITLLRVCPYPAIAGRPIARADYRLTFLVGRAGQLYSPPNEGC